MTLQGWIGLVFAFISLVITIVALASQGAKKQADQESRLSILETEIKMHKESILRHEDELKLHNSLNERTFAKIEAELTEISRSLNQLIGMFNAKFNK